MMKKLRLFMSAVQVCGVAFAQGFSVVPEKKIRLSEQMHIEEMKFPDASGVKYRYVNGQLVEKVLYGMQNQENNRSFAQDELSESALSSDLVLTNRYRAIDQVPALNEVIEQMKPSDGVDTVFEAKKIWYWSAMKLLVDDAEKKDEKYTQASLKSGADLIFNDLYGTRQSQSITDKNAWIDDMIADARRRYEEDFLYRDNRDAAKYVPLTETSYRAGYEYILGLIAKVRVCNVAVANELEAMLTSGKIILTEDTVKVVREFETTAIQNKGAYLSAISAKYPEGWMTAATNTGFVAGKIKILPGMLTQVETDPTQFAKRVLTSMNKNSYFKQIYFSDPKTDLDEYLGQYDWDSVDLVHEFGHVRQSKLFSDLDRRRFDEFVVNNLTTSFAHLHPALKVALYTRMYEPSEQALESSAEFFALDAMAPCL